MNAKVISEEITKAQIDAEVNRLRLVDRELYWETNGDNAAQIRAVRLQMVNVRSSKETRKTPLTDWMSRADFLAWLQGQP